ncbi:MULTISPECIES: UDP-2,4-diacetamido-2,4,6-trideoxy-beta-L-altropyranose hydrolase [Rhizobium/Agrobacterium group]|uniref:UDP-2,4-diacetamido-2,4, 6-trideoxy-beta-L-altropyranose hydrolase n=1 Tax=Rhizobium oryzihabitans TaxID=2267833 RepID=UPI004034B0C7
MMIIIRADASDRIGSGHVMRCLCLANTLRKSGSDVLFISRDMPRHLALLLAEEGHDLTAIDTDPADVLMDARFTAERAEGADWIVVDHYGLGADWEKSVGSAARVMAIDDLARPHDCDLLLDQNHDPKGGKRYAGLVPDRTVVLVGPRYALLRQEFPTARLHRQTISTEVRRIVVFLGGMDQDNITGRVLTALEAIEIGEPQIDVIIGASHPARRSIEEICAQRPGYDCHIQVRNMAEHFVGADLVVGAGGTATWERCSVGAPTLALCIAENQKDLLHHASRLGLVYAPEISPRDEIAIARHIQALVENSALRENLSRQGLDLVDGRGADRVVARLRGGLIRMRRAAQGDCDAVHAWRNAPAVRHFSHDPSEIPIEGHRAWFERMLTSDRHDLLIGELHEQPVGVVRFDIDGSLAVISIYLVPEMLGQGLGSDLLQAAETWLRAHRPSVARISADVRSDNHASCSLFATGQYLPNSTNYCKDLRS